jgi:hypothetical protein
MYLLYLDDSGSVSATNQEYLVLGGVALFERQVYWVSQELERIADHIDPGNAASIEFHASEAYSGRVPTWKGMHRPNRIKAIKDVLQVLGSDRRGMTAFACAVHKPSFPNSDPMELAFEDLCSRFDIQLRRKYTETEEKARGLIILDKTVYETTLQTLARDFRQIGTRWGVINNLADIPFFVDSRASRAVQLADHVAYSVFRRYESGDTSYFDLIASKFDADETGKLHGLVHRQKINPNCMCPACYGRRKS